MKYSLECQVASNIVFRQPVRFMKGDVEFVFSPNEQGILSTIKLTQKVSEPQKFFSEIIDNPKTITIQQDPEVHQELISYFQYLEGHIGLVAGLKKVFWNEPKAEWIPETEDERAKLKVFSAHFWRANPNQTTGLNLNLLEEIITDKPILDRLTVLLSFYRESRVFFDRQEYVNSFYDSYFILEDLYGGGKWRNIQVEESFKASPELKQIITWALTILNEQHKKEIMSLLQQKSLTYTLEDVIVLLVEMRGHLHHFSRVSSIKLKPSPLAQHNYESLAFLTMAITMKSILLERDKLRKESKR